MPRLVGGAGLHRAEDAHQPRMLASPRDDVFHPVFLPEVPFAHELDFDAGFRRQLFGILANPVPLRFAEPRIVENPDLPLKQERSHSPGKADPGNVPKINIRSKQPNRPSICAACRPVNSSLPIPKS